MVSLWGQNKGDNPDNDGAAGRSSEENHAGNDGSARDQRDADERTRLLPQSHDRRPRSGGYLDPDDPAVSISLFFHFCLHNLG